MEQYKQQFIATKSAIQYWIRRKLDLDCEDEDIIIWGLQFHPGDITFNLGFNPDKLLNGDIDLNEHVLKRLLTLFEGFHSDLRLKGSEDALLLFEIRVGIKEYFSRWEDPPKKRRMSR